MHQFGWMDGDWMGFIQMKSKMGSRQVGAFLSVLGHLGPTIRKNLKTKSAKMAPQVPDFERKKNLKLPYLDTGF
jgi:hypothetical protein